MSNAKVKKIGRSAKVYDFLVTFMDQMKYTISVVMNTDKPDKGNYTNSVL